MRRKRISAGRVQYRTSADGFCTTWSYASIGWTARLFDDLGHLTNEVNSAGMIHSADWENNCCGKASDTDATGLTTEYQYDDLLRVKYEDRELGSTNVITGYDYDLANRRICTTVQAGDIAQISSNRYDTAGRLDYSIDTQGIKTTYQYSADGLTNVTIRAGLTNTTVRYLDGRTHYTVQNEVRQSTYEYGVNPDGSQWTKTYTGKDGLTSAIWQISTTDFLGRNIKTERPGFGGTTLVGQNYYNTNGWLTNVTATGQADIYYFYNELGERIRAVQDLDNIGVIDFDGDDRISESSSLFVQDESSDWWLASYQAVYTNSSAIPVTNGISRTRLTGLGLAKTVEIDGASHAALVTGEKVDSDIRGNEATSLQLVNRGQKMILSLSSTPASAFTNAAVTTAGLQVKSVTATGVVTTNWYDSLGRRIMSGNLSDDVLQSNPSTIAELEEAVADSDSRNIFTLVSYNGKGQVEWTRNAASNATWYAYNDYGQRYAEIQGVTEDASLTSAQLENEADVLGLLDDEDFSVSYTAYSSEGQVIATWGNAYPVAYEYDDQNRMVAMATTRNENLRNVCLLNQIPAGETLTSWQPAANDKIDITKWQYDSATGLLTDKVYSDGKGPEYVYTSDGKLSQRTWARGVTTDYKYSFSGSLTNIVYNDSTPYVAYTYNRLGQQLSAVTYDSTTGAYVTSNTFVYTPTLELDYELQNGALIDRSTDFLGRNTGFSLLNSAEQAVNAVSYSYDAYGRFSTLQATTPGDTDTFTYSYLPGTGLISGYSAATGGAASPLNVSRTYELNRNLITAITNSVGSVPSVVDAFTYHNDALGRRTQRSDYYNDGNNPSTTANTFGYNTFSEVTNAVMGTGAYAYNYDPIGNRQSAKLNDDTTSYAANGLNQYTNITGGVVSAPTYDLDGNMTFLPSTSGGGAGGEGWHCQWDAENRLIIASSLIGGVVARYTYDHQSRRIYKTVVNSSILSYISSFTYDGWNLIQEVSTYLSSGTISTNLYVWGLDLSGSLQGAGGVGGLLSQTKITASGASSYFPLADANGNCVTYLDNAGKVQAHYTYDAFGGTVSSGGDMDDVFSFRFSSKYLDDETGLYYYGLRYYAPVLGQWLSRDLIGVLGGLNTYSFVYNSGLSYADYLGLTVVVRELPDTPPWNRIFRDPDKYLYKFPNLKTYDEDFEKFKDRINKALDVLGECCKKEGLGDNPICQMLNSREEYTIHVIPQENESNKVDQGYAGGKKNPNDIKLEMPWNGPDAELLFEVYQMNGGVASVYNMTVPSLIVHEAFHVLNPDVLDPTEQGNLDAENQMRKCCPELGENFTRDVYSKPNLRIKGIPPLDYHPNVNLNWIYNF